MVKEIADAVEDGLLTLTLTSSTMESLLKLFIPTLAQLVNVTQMEETTKYLLSSLLMAAAT